MSEPLQDLVKEFYFHELADKHKLDSRMPALVLIMSAIPGLLYFGYREFTPGAHWFDLVVEGATILSGALWLLAFFYLVWGTLEPKYERIPSTGEMAGTYADLQEYHRTQPDQPGSSESDLRGTLTTRMIEATDQNVVSNLKRGARYYWVMVFMTGSIVFALMASGFVAVDDVHRHRKEKQAMKEQESKDSGGSQGSSKPAPPNTVQPAPVKPVPSPNTVPPASVKPVLPPNTVYKGGHEPPGKRVIPDKQKPKEGAGR